MLGAEGIAVGMSTRILPHNLAEIWQAQIAILNKEDFELFPDFQQGGLMDVSAYEDGARQGRGAREARRAGPQDRRHPRAPVRDDDRVD